MVAAALIDRLVHHATMITLKGKSYRLRKRGLDVMPPTASKTALVHFSGLGERAGVRR
jgi:hypothetical protein